MTTTETTAARTSARTAPTQPTEPLETIEPLRTRVRSIVARAWDAAIASGALPPIDEPDRPALELERPPRPEHGDFATSVAL